MRILGIDPGYDRLGVAIIEKEKGGKEILLFSTCIETSRAQSFAERLLTIGDALSAILETWNPDVLAIEELYMGSNQKTAMRVAEARGTILYLAAKSGLLVRMFTPQEIKVATTGYGKSDKAQVTYMVARLVTLTPKKRLDDEYDAIAVALTAAAIRE